MILNKNEIVVLINFLKSSMSTRELDKLLGHSSKKTKGWKSWEILKKYMLKNEDKGKLFLYSVGQSKNIIRKLMNKPKLNLINFLIRKNPPKKLEKYKNTYVLAESEKAFYNIFSGETRNIIQSFFNPKKRIINRCQFKDCTHKQLDTVHYLQKRSAIFMQCAKLSRKKVNGNIFSYDIYRTMKCFLSAHEIKKSVCFLCKKHHNKFHKFEKSSKSVLNAFKKDIYFN